MKLFASKQDPMPAPTPAPDVQARPVRFAAGALGAIGQLKVDLAWTLGTRLVVAGWRSVPVELALFAHGTRLKTRLVPVARADVAAHLALDLPEELGFVLVADMVTEGRGDPAGPAGPGELSIGWRSSGDHFEQTRLTPSPAPDAFSAADQGALGSAMALLIARGAHDTVPWPALVAHIAPAQGPCPQAAGYLEGALVSRQTGRGVVFGWALHDPEALVWLEDDEGHIATLDGAFRRYRQDVMDAVGRSFPRAEQLDTGFTLLTGDFKLGARVRLKGVSEDGVHVISETFCTELSADPLQAARHLLNLQMPIQDLHQRIMHIDEPLLAPVIAGSQARWARLPVRVQHLGQAVAAPRVSVIVPLYGRADFVEHQMVELVRDPWVRAHAELVYVLDDPKLVDAFSQQAQDLFRLYRLPFTWVWGSVNRGYSGANNLGAAHARGEHLVFLNSDAFPQQPGWLAELVGVLTSRPDIGAVGPRLVFGHGAIQHAGMEFLRRDELGIWVNHHPHMGLDPALDPHTDLTLVPAVTGACLALRRGDFDRVGGWDTGYLIGDFEDSDLCLKLRSAGLHIAYLPTVQLVHLERQSFKLLGSDEFRTRVVVYNAVRHQQRWASVIESESTLA